MASALATARAIARTLRAARRQGKLPEAVILSPDLRDQLQSATIGIMERNTAKPDLLLNVPVEVDPQAEGWAVRVR
jgi:hypothetical protein